MILLLNNDQCYKIWSAEKRLKKIIHASIQISSVFQLSLNNSTLAQTAKLGWFIKNEFNKETTLQRVSLKSIVPFLFLTINSRSRTFLLNNVIWSSFKRKTFLSPFWSHAYGIFYASANILIFLHKLFQIK